MRTLGTLGSLLALAAAPAVALAQNESAQQAAGPPVQRIATASAVSTEPLGSIMGVRELPDGRVLVNDGARRRLLLMDTTLKTVEVVLDSLSEIANTYGTRPGMLIPYRGDTTLFVDPASYAIVVLDATGRTVRVRSVWRVEHVPSFANTSGAYGWPGVDAKGRIVYRVRALPARPLRRPPSNVPYIPPEPDSAFVVAADLETRTSDTLGVVRIPKTELRIRQTTDRGFTVDNVVNPLPATDDWAVLPDGRVAFVRWRDYRIEYLNPDGQWTSSPKLPYAWQRLTDEDKQRLADSVKTAQERMARMQFVSSMIRWVNEYGKGYPANFTAPDGYMLPPGLPKDWMLPQGVKFPATYIYACPPGVEPPATSALTLMTAATLSSGAVPTPVRSPTGATPAGAAPAGGMPSCFPAPVTVSSGITPPVPTPRPVNVMSPLDLPDYRPPLPTGGAVRADADGNLWIRTIPPKPIPGGTVYDIVSPDGELVNRLQTPPGYTIAGFGKGKIVYLSMRDQSGIHLARVRLK